MIYAKSCSSCYKPTRLHEETNAHEVYARCDNCNTVRKHYVHKFKTWSRYYAYMLTRYGEASHVVYEVGKQETFRMFGSDRELARFADQQRDYIGAYHADAGVKPDKDYD